MEVPFYLYKGGVGNARDRKHGETETAHDLFRRGPHAILDNGNSLQKFETLDSGVVFGYVSATEASVLLGGLFRHPLAEGVHRLFRYFPFPWPAAASSLSC